MIAFERAILHLDLDAFFVEAELLDKHELRGRPVIVGGGERGVVASCSYEARARGVRSAMPVARALRLCPEAVVLPGTRGLYARLSRQVTEIIADSVPLFEKASIDEFYADLSGMERHFGCWAVAQALRRRIQSETGLPISICLAANKTTAKIGVSEAKPNGELCVYPGEEKAFLAPLPVSRIPSVGGKTEQILLRRGIRTIGQLA
ncbi:MAG: DNA polymerase IV, partial [Saprospiraceae bacterium]